MTTGCRQYSTDRPFEGVLPNMERRFRETDSAWVREELGRYQNAQDLRGVRRRAPQARGAGGQDRREEHQRGGGAVDLGGRRLVRRRRRDADPEPAARSPPRILKEINERLGFLRNVGLEYLTLARASGDAVGRREPAHPAGLADRLRADRGALRARRAVDRAAPARQRAAAWRR